MSFRAMVRRNGPAAQPMVWPGVSESAPNQSFETARPGEQAGAPPPEAEMLRQAHQAGWNEGEAAGKQQAQSEMRTALERLAQSVQELARLRAGLREQAEGDLVRLAVAIARRVLRRELMVDPDAIEGLVRAALEKLNSQETARVRVHPEYAGAVKTLLVGAGRSAVEVAADAALEPGSVIFETARGNLDASVEAQLAEIERGLTDRFRGAR